MEEGEVSFFFLHVHVSSLLANQLLIHCQLINHNVLIENSACLIQQKTGIDTSEWFKRRFKVLTLIVICMVL